MLGMIAVPAGITLHTVRAPAVVQMTSSNPTPYGYSWSLLLFVVPIVVIGWWFLPSEEVRISQRAFWRTIWILLPCGFGLDFFLASRFFLFPNTEATVGIRAPALGGSVPIEEYIFYFTGFVATLLIYVWLDEYWLADYRGFRLPRRSKASQTLADISSIFSDRRTGVDRSRHPL